VIELRESHCTKLFSALVFALALTSAGCKGCQKGPPPLAILSASVGTVTRDHAANPKQWAPAAVGETFFLGDAIKTESAATAKLTLANGTSLSLKEASLLRFMDSKPTENNFTVELGEVMVQAGTEPLRFASRIGLAILEPGASMIITQDGKKMRYEVMIGTASFAVDGADPVKMVPGQRIQVDLETALIERMDEETKPAEPTKVAGAEKPEPQQGDIAATVTGKRVRYRSTLSDEWAAMDPGVHTVGSGGIFDIPAKASVRVARGREAATMHGHGQFRLGGADGLVEATLGRVSVDRHSGETVIVVPGGSITVKADTGVGDVAVDANHSSQLRMREGSATVKSASGSDEISAGETLKMDAQGRMQIDGRGPEVADISVAAGESFVVHDPSPPTVVQVKFPKNCGDGGRLRIGASRVVNPRKGADTSAMVSLTAGSHNYEIVCGGVPQGKGTIQITRDEGTADLPRLAPATIVDVDGRKYTILYQNLLPEIRVSWPKAPKAAQYELVLTSGTSKKTFPTTKPKYVFKSSSITEGNHSFVFRTLDAGATASPETTVKIRFDNAAPAAVVRAPQNRKFKAGETVDVAGSALPGWVVTAQGSPLALDPNRRFSGQVQSTVDQRALAIRFEHRERGVHYYLRRASGRVQ
jgi:ferric-dicitrate binding protein FerR (iron transport regulator)